jgi:hypothetical protein
MRHAATAEASDVGHAAVTDPLTVLVIDDHATFSDLLALGLKHEPGLTCVGTATSVARGKLRCSTPPRTCECINASTNVFTMLRNKSGLGTLEVLCHERGQVNTLGVGGHRVPLLE